ANLMLARGAGREREMAIRFALGARRVRVVQQLLTEGIVLALSAAVLGLMLAFAGVRALVAFAPGEIPRLEQAGINITVLGFAFVVALAATLLFSLGPALRSTRRNVQERLAMRSQSASRGARRTRDLLVVAEFAIAMILLTG